MLLDESLPRPLARLLPEHEVRTVTQMGWRGMKNGALLRQAAASAFDVLLTADQKIEFQQNLSLLPVAVVVLVAPTNRLDALEPLLPALRSALAVLQPRQLVRVPATP